ncbi:WD40 repeat domain-containing protein [Psychromonas hadalis]|uniref:WD40 repeat domain-containing protein n=1 Tax=Psychromonas hadalis TaxID=211669 RepID=UPI0003B4B5CF|nr:WD40 repeat domain-containing protein [Psychromonas hadalis]
MNFHTQDVINADNSKALRFPWNKCSIEIIDVESQQILHQRTEVGQYHTCGMFTENENIVIYFSFDKNWFIPPLINIWDLKSNTVEQICTFHHFQASVLTFTFHNATKRLVLGDFDGYISAFSMQTHKEIWHHETPKHNDILSLSFSICGEKVAALQKDNLTVYDFTTGNKLLSTPLMDEYSTCQFQEEDLFIHLTHPGKTTIKINCKTIYR